MSNDGVYRVPRADNMEYVNYLKSIEDQWPEYTLFRVYLEENSKGRQWPREAGVTGHVQFHDILSDNSILPPLSLRANENLDIKEMENIISSPPASLRSRLIVVGLNHRKIVNQGVLDLLRLSFDIEPAFFWSLLSAEDSEVVVPRLRGFLRIDYMTLKILRNFPSPSGDVSVAIIAINEAGIPWDIEHSNKRLDPFLFTLHEQPSLTDRGSPRFDPADLIQTFCSLLFTQQTTSSEEDLFQCLLLVAKVHLAGFHQFTAPYRANNSYEGSAKDAQLWYNFRKKLNHLKVDLRACARYAKREFSISVFQEQLKKTLEDQEELLAEGQALESLLRDSLQTSVGVQSLKESRMSIEEGKRNKLVTILAFIFLPTSLTSSVSGMNVQEINNTGKSIWIFMVTAILLTSAAVTAWFLSGLARAKWHSRDNEPAVLRGGTDRSRKKRFSHAMWLLGNPNAWKDMPQGTMLGLVTNGRFGERAPQDSVMVERLSHSTRNTHRQLLRMLSQAQRSSEEP